MAVCITMLGKLVMILGLALPLASRGTGLPTSSADDDANPLLSVAELAGRRGYNVSSHHVTTSDGFVLEAFRFPHKRDTPSKGVVVFLSGWLCQVAMLIVNEDPAGNIPYWMVEAGYTVWMINHRNKPWPNHTKYKPTDPEIWNYTNKDMIYTDIPAHLTYIQEQEAGKKVTLVGHSRGGFFTALFAASPQSASFLHAAVLIGGTSPLVTHPPAPAPASASADLYARARGLGTAPVVDDELLCRPCGPKSAHWPGCCGGIGPLEVADPHVRASDAHGGGTARICRDALRLPATRHLCTDMGHDFTGGNATLDPQRIPVLFAFYPSYESVGTQNVAALPVLKAGDVTVPVILFAGREDKMVPLWAAKLVAADLRAAGKLLDFTILDGYGHGDEILALDCGATIGGHLDDLLTKVT